MCRCRDYHPPIIPVISTMSAASVKVKEQTHEQMSQMSCCHAISLLAPVCHLYAKIPQVQASLNWLLQPKLLIPILLINTKHYKLFIQ